MRSAVDSRKPTRLQETGQPRGTGGTVTGLVDVHCHCLPGLDDGPESRVQSIELCRALVADGVHTVVATPHQLGRYELQNGNDRIRQAVHRLRMQLDMLGIELDVLPGADVRIDERLPALIDSDDVMTLADRKKFLLLELPHDVLIDPRRLIRDLMRKGIVPILTHPERHRHLQQSPELLRSWRECGAWMQITAGSLCGDFGPGAAATAQAMIEMGIVDIVATDAHNVARRPPRMQIAIAMLRSMLPEPEIRRICVENPSRAVGGAA